MVKYPFGAVDTQALTATGAQAQAITNDSTILDAVTTIGTGNRTINLTIASEVKTGATILVKFRTTGTETCTFGTGFLAPVITGVASKTFSQKFTYDGSTFLPDGTSVQCN